MAKENQGGQRCPITGLSDCRQRSCELHYMDAPLRLMPEDPKERVQTVISSTILEGHFWDGDEHAEYAVLMDRDDPKRDVVWYRSRDWVHFGTVNGWHRVAKILEA